jgi:hypothetical protein
MKRMYEFRCSNGHTEEKFIDESVRDSTCSCGEVSKRIVSMPAVKLEGVTGAFPGAYSKWERVRAEKLAQERKKNASHGNEYTPM